MTTVIGLDLSLTNTGIARITWNTDQWTCDTARRGFKGTKGAPWPARAERIRRLLATIAEEILPADLVVLEGPSYSSVSTSAHDRSWLWGVVYDRLDVAGVPVVVVAPKSAKKWATGDGNADKDDMVVAAVKTWPEVEGIKNDTADALALAGIGMHLLGGPAPFALTAYRCAVVNGLRPDLLEQVA